MEINKEELKLWIAALRSGEYKQGTGALQTGSGYCCLGVACKVLIPQEKLQLDWNGFYMLGAFPAAQPAVPQWLKSINEDFEKKHGTTLGVLNDQEGLTFSEIADLLEKYYLTESKSMTPQELLIPRYLVVGDWPGREPDKFNIGDIITETNNPKELPRDQNGNLRWRYDWGMYHQLFYKLNWYDRRDDSVFNEIKYLKNLHKNEVYQIDGFEKDFRCYTGYIYKFQPLNEVKRNMFDIWELFPGIIPITEEEFNEFNNKNIL